MTLGPFTDLVKNDTFLQHRTVVNAIAAVIESLRKDSALETNAPTLSNDSSENYDVGSYWLHDDSGNSRIDLYQAIDVTVGAAVWVKIGSTDPVETRNILSTYSTSEVDQLLQTVANSSLNALFNHDFVVDWEVTGAATEPQVGDATLNDNGDTATLTYDVSEYIGSTFFFEYDLTNTTFGSAAGGDATVSSGSLFSNTISTPAGTIEVDSGKHQFVIPDDLPNNELVILFEKTFGDSNAVIAITNVILRAEGSFENPLRIELTPVKSGSGYFYDSTPDGGSNFEIRNEFSSANLSTIYSELDVIPRTTIKPEIVLRSVDPLIVDTNMVWNADVSFVGQGSILVNNPLTFENCNVSFSLSGLALSDTLTFKNCNILFKDAAITKSTDSGFCVFESCTVHCEDDPAFVGGGFDVDYNGGLTDLNLFTLNNTSFTADSIDIRSLNSNIASNFRIFNLEYNNKLTLQNIEVESGSAVNGTPTIIDISTGASNKIYASRTPEDIKLGNADDYIVKFRESTTFGRYGGNEVIWFRVAGGGLGNGAETNWISTYEAIRNFWIED